MVSIIIPNYNHEDYLNRRIDSVMHQTYTDFEIILLDDCSTDRSKEILLSYKDHPKVSRILINEKNTGSPFEQWAKGFELAKGDFVWIAESDDWCENTLLDTLVKPMLEDNSLVLSFCQSLLVTDDEEIIYRTESNRIIQKINGHEFVKTGLFGDTVIVNAGMAVFRKTALSNIDSQYREMKSAGDWMFWVQIALQGTIFISCKTLNYCLRHKDTVTSNAEINGQDIREGNSVFNYVLEKTNPTNEEIRNAVRKRFNIFFDQKSKYTTLEIRKSSLKGILSLHPNAKIIYRKIFIKKIIYSFFDLIKTRLKK